MTKDNRKMGKNGGVSGLKPQAAKRPVRKGDARKVPGKIVLPVAKEKGRAKAGADKKTLIMAAVVLVVLLLVVWFCKRPQTAPDKAPAARGMTQTAQSPAQQTQPKAVAEATPTGAEVKAGEATKIGPVISAVRIMPSQPLATDPIRAEAVLVGGALEGVSFSYRWKVNDQFASLEGTDTLTDVPLKRRDRISAVVAATKDGVTGPPTESPTVIIHSPPPSLAMKIMTDSFRPGDAVEIQLIGKTPDNDPIVYSLVSPFVEGMTLDKNTGKIIWKPERLLPGKLQFGAACSDTDGNKAVQIFALDFGVGAPQ